MPVFQSGATQKISRTTQLIQSSSDYAVVFYVRFRSFPTGADYSTLFTYINAGYTAYVGLFAYPGGLVALNMDNGTGPALPATPTAPLTTNTWYPVAYTRSGTTHSFYFGGSLITAYTYDLNLTTPTWVELLSGYDGFSVNDFDIWGVREFDTFLSALPIRLEWESAVPKHAGPATDTPLLTDLLDRTANHRDWVASPVPSTFVAGPGDRRPVVRPTTLLTGTWVRFTNCLFSAPTKLFLLEVLSGVTLSDDQGTPTGGRVIARVSLVFGSATAGGLPGNIIWLSSHFSLLVEYLSATTFLLVSGAVVADPWVDPVVGTSQSTPTIRYIDVTPHRVALFLQSSTFSGGVYGNDGSINVYVDDVLVSALSGLHFADAHPFSPSPTRAAAYGCEQVIDHVWARFGVGTPHTDANGVVLDTTNLWYQDDFANGNLVAWGPHQSKVVIPQLYPHAVSDVGGAGGYGLSISASAGTTIVQTDSPLLSGPGLVRLWWDDIEPTPPIPPTPPPAACPVSLAPLPVVPPAACPVNLVP